METGGLHNAPPGSESQEEEPAPPGTSTSDLLQTTIKFPNCNASAVLRPNMASPITLTSKGVENAKKRLRAFSIQKKTAMSPVTVPKPIIGSGNTTVFIGKLTGVKTTPKPLEDPAGEHKKPLRPPKPGMSKKYLQDSYTDLQKRTLSEIEDMKRKMELVELGIPLGLICPSSTSDKAMPTKAMPPIKSFLDPAKVDDLIREAKKAKAEGREFKFDYQKLLPDYDNPFQRKKDEIVSSDKKSEEHEHQSKVDRVKEKDRRKSDRYEPRRYSSHRKVEKDKHRDGRDKDKEKTREKEEKSRDKEEVKEAKKSAKIEKETDVNLKDYLVCDSWSLDNEDKNNSSSPLDDKNKQVTPVKRERKSLKNPVEHLKESFTKKDKSSDSPVSKSVKIEKLNPVIDEFKFELEDDILDLYDGKSSRDKYEKVKRNKDDACASPIAIQLCDYEQNSKDLSMDGMTDETFLESIINEIKQEELSDDSSQDKGLVEYDVSPVKDDEIRDSITPEIDDRIREIQSSRSDYSDGYKSTESGYKSTESEYKLNLSEYKGDSCRSESYRSSVDRELDVAEARMAKSTVDSLETWSFVLKICQPLLFRHDKNKCYKETRTTPKLWFTENPKLCNCVKDRSVVYEELEMCKMGLVDRVYGCDQILDGAYPKVRNWYPRLSHCLAESGAEPLSSEWEAEDSQASPPLAGLAAPGPPPRTARDLTPQRNEEIYLDREYQRFMEAVWPDVSEPKPETPRSTTPVRQEIRKKKKSVEEKDTEDKKKVKKIKLSSEGWSQESDLEEDVDKSKKNCLDKDKEKHRKRKHSPSSLSDSEDEEEAKKRKKLLKKKENKKAKANSSKRRRLNKKYLKKLKEKQKKKRKLLKFEKIEDSDDEDYDISDKKKDRKKAKKKKSQKLKKNQKKKAKAKSSSSETSSSSSDSSSDSESEIEKRKKKKKSDVKKRKKKRKQSSSDSTQSDDMFDVNILKNIKTERLTDDEKSHFSPRKHKPREIINVKELQKDFVGNNIHIKQEAIEEKEAVEGKKVDETDNEEVQHTETVETEEEPDENKEIMEFKEPQTQDMNRFTPQLRPVTEESNLSQCSSQESVYSIKDTPIYEKDESHLRPSSQNSNYSFNDVIQSQSALYQKGIDAEMDDKFSEGYEQGNYEMYEHLAMAYQSDVASQQTSPPSPCAGSRRIETVVRARSRGEIKCDWRAGDSLAAPPPPRPSRWGLKPGEVNIVLTGAGSRSPVHTPGPVYRIQSIANRTDNSASGYDEAYMDTYGALDRLQYGDCFAPAVGTTGDRGATGDLGATGDHAAGSQCDRRATSSLDARIHHALTNSVLGEVAKETDDPEADKDGPEKGILITKSLAVNESGRGVKRVSFADGYKPGQDSDVEEPPVKKKRKARRVGCAWPCPATHPDHVPLWDALPPPPPPAGSPPPPAAPPPLAPAALQLLRARRPPPALLPTPPHPALHKFDPNAPLPGFMPPEPPPGLITFP